MSDKEKGKVFLLPCFISETEYGDVLPEKVRETVASLQYFAVENVRSARRFIKKILPGKNIDEAVFFDIGKRSDAALVGEAMGMCLNGHDLGVISEAGVPAVADPGALVVREAHRKVVRVVPLCGPSSLVMALMASGLSGQNFAFNGYLPIDVPARAARLRQLEQRSEKEFSAQMFIETPFRNVKMFEAVLAACSPFTSLCVAADITGEQEFIATYSVAQWRKLPIPDIDKRPTVFIIQKDR